MAAPSAHVAPSIPSAPSALRAVAMSRRHRGLAGLAVEDLLEHLAHPGAHQVPAFGVEIVVAATRPRGLAGVQRLPRLLAGGVVPILVHAAIVARDRCVVNRAPGQGAKCPCPRQPPRVAVTEKDSGRRPRSSGRTSL